MKDSKDITGLKPERVWKYFSEICAVPHPSHHEEAIRRFLVDKAGEFGVECIEDKAGNVIMRKKAAPGMEERQGIILQAHMDMVPQKNSDKAFDFLRDPIAAFVDGDWVTADGTTLGADNGMGMAAILAVMEAGDIEHGPLEALITATEETGMEGAFGLEPGVLKGSILLNLDSETEGELYVGCAGGLDANITFDYKEEPLLAAATYRALRLEVKGLKGGHSGIEIGLGRGNANKILARFLWQADRQFGIRLASIDGGGLRNAIPREAFATVMVPMEHLEQFRVWVPTFGEVVREELHGVDDGLSVAVADAPTPSGVIEAGVQRRLIDALYGCPNGVIRMSASMPGLVQTSTNLARVVSGEGKIDVQCLLRSASNSEKEDLATMIACVFELAGARVDFSGGYDGWNPDMDSPILKTMAATYKELYGRDPAVMAIHAGLECGIIGGKYPSLDMISFGPTISHPHSPDEKVEIASVGKFWDFLLATLRNAPKK